MNKIPLLINNKILLCMVLIFIPFLVHAEAGKSIDSTELLLALLFFVLTILNQFYLIGVSINRILTPNHKSTVLHKISLAISILGCLVYFSNSETHEMGVFGWIVLIPCLIGIITMAIEVSRGNKQK